MKLIKRLFCKHNYILIKTDSADYCTDWLYFSDIGMWDANSYLCTKCEKIITKTEKNKKHPCYVEKR